MTATPVTALRWGNARNTQYRWRATVARWQFRGMNVPAGTLRDLDDRYFEWLRDETTLPVVTKDKKSRFVSQCCEILGRDRVVADVNALHGTSLLLTLLGAAPGRPPRWSDTTVRECYSTFRDVLERHWNVRTYQWPLPPLVPTSERDRQLAKLRHAKWRSSRSDRHGDLAK